MQMNKWKKVNVFLNRQKVLKNSAFKRLIEINRMQNKFLFT